MRVRRCPVSLAASRAHCRCLPISARNRARAAAFSRTGSSHAIAQSARASSSSALVRQRSAHAGRPCDGGRCRLQKGRRFSRAEGGLLLALSSSGTALLPSPQGNRSLRRIARMPGVFYLLTPSPLPERVHSPDGTELCRILTSDLTDRRRTVWPPPDATIDGRPARTIRTGRPPRRARRQHRGVPAPTEATARQHRSTTGPVATSRPSIQQRHDSGRVLDRRVSCACRPWRDECGEPSQRVVVTIAWWHGRMTSSVAEQSTSSVGRSCGHADRSTPSRRRFSHPCATWRHVTTMNRHFAWSSGGSG